MADPNFGYRHGVRNLVSLPVKAAETWEAGDALVLSSGYLAKAAAGGALYAVAVEAVPTAPTSNGDIKALVDLSPDSVYLWPVGTGTITQAMQGTLCDLSGSQGIDVTASADDCVLIVKPIVGAQGGMPANSALIQIRPAAAGVV